MPLAPYGTFTFDDLDADRPSHAKYNARGSLETMDDIPEIVPTRFPECTRAYMADMRLRHYDRYDKTRELHFRFHLPPRFPPEDMRLTEPVLDKRVFRCDNCNPMYAKYYRLKFPDKFEGSYITYSPSASGMLHSQLYQAWECGCDFRWVCLGCQNYLYRDKAFVDLHPLSAALLSLALDTRLGRANENSLATASTTKTARRATRGRAALTTARCFLSSSQRYFPFRRVGLQSDSFP